jgi:hypothetical protein
MTSMDQGPPRELDSHESPPGLITPPFPGMFILQEKEAVDAAQLESMLADSSALAQMIAERKAARHFENVDEGRTVSIAESVLQEKESVDGALLANMFANFDEERAIRIIDETLLLPEKESADEHRRTAFLGVRGSPVDNCNGGEAVYRGDERHSNMDSDSAKTPIESTKKKHLQIDPLSHEFRELAQIAAKCLHERNVLGRTNKVPWNVIKEKIASCGSARLKKVCNVKSKPKSVFVRNDKTDKRGDGERISAPVGSPLIMPPELQELARLVVECTGADSKNLCHETLAVKVLSSECQMLKDRWNGMARLSRFQRDGYLMVIPRLMRKMFEIHLDDLIASLKKNITGPSVANPAGKHHSTPTCDLKEPPPVITPCPQKKPIQFAATATTTEPCVTKTYHATEDLGYEAQDDGMSCGDITDNVPANKVFFNAADSATRKRDSTAFSNECHGRKEPNTKHLKTVPGSVPSSTPSEFKHDIDLFFKWRHRRLDLAQEQFLEESTSVGDVDRAKIDFKTHYAVELSMLTELKECCCANSKVGSSHCLLVESFFEQVAVNWHSFFTEAINSCVSFCERKQRRSTLVSPFVNENKGKRRHCYKLFLDAEKAWVQFHLEILSIVAAAPFVVATMEQPPPVAVAVAPPVVAAPVVDVDTATTTPDASAAVKKSPAAAVVPPVKKPTGQVLLQQIQQQLQQQLQVQLQAAGGHQANMTPEQIQVRNVISEVYL